MRDRLEDRAPRAEVTQLGAPGSRLGLLLGPGGIRGCAHAGVLSVLDDLGLVADVIVGSSIGSIFGAAYAAGWEPSKLRLLTDLAPRRTVAEFYWHRLRIDGSTYIGSLLSELGRGTLIEDLPRRFAAMATDRETGKVVALTRGPLLEAVEASIALPGIARSVTIGNTNYVDGGLRGAIPSSVAYELGAEMILRVELVGNHPLKLAYRRFTRSRLSSFISRGSGRSMARGVGTALQTVTNVPEVTITPQFYGLFCNAPLGIGFCVKRGRLAAAAALNNLG